MSRPAFELAGIFRQYAELYRRTRKLPLQQLRVMRAIQLCRTSALGGHAEKCGQCSYTRTLIEYAMMAGFIALAAGATMPGIATSISTV